MNEAEIKSRSSGMTRILWCLWFMLVPASALQFPSVTIENSPALLVSRPVSTVRLSGSGRRKFLHGLCTAHIEAMEEGGVLEASVVDSLGHMKHMLTVFEVEDALLGLSAYGQGGALASFLDRYAFPADNVNVEDVSGAYNEAWELCGTSAVRLLADALGLDPIELPSPGRCVRLMAPALGSMPLLVLGADSLGFQTGGTAAEADDCSSFTLLCDSSSATATLTSTLRQVVDDAGGAVADTCVHAATRAPSTATRGLQASRWLRLRSALHRYESLRVLRGRPAIGREFGDGASIALDGVDVAPTPLELGLWKSVHLDKGCYLGQEMVARLVRVKV